MAKELKIGLALGSGGMCGVAHIGFLQVLEENGIKLDMISGVSMGSIVAGLYASGLSAKEMEEVALKLSKSDIIKLNLFKIVKQGLLSGEKIEEYLNTVFKTKNIEDARIKYFAQAVDFSNGETKVFDQGSFAEAVHASSAIPGVIAPLYKDDTMYIDGGIAEVVPFNILRKNGCDVVIAVNSLGQSHNDISKHVIQTAATSVDYLQYHLWKQSKKLYKDNYDIYCFDRLDTVSPLETDMKKIPELIAFGRQCAEQYIDEIKEIIAKKQKELEAQEELNV